jgi:hypothetical protein
MISIVSNLDSKPLTTYAVPVKKWFMKEFSITDLAEILNASHGPPLHRCIH